MSSQGGSSHTAKRREARERAVEIVFEAEMRGIPIGEILGLLRLPLDDFAGDLLDAFGSHRPRAEGLIEKSADGWTLERMPSLDRLIMVLAIAELLGQATPKGVVLSEAVALAGRYSTEESSRFVNGVLSSVVEELRP